MSNVDLCDLNRMELLELSGEIEELLKRFRPYRIKERFVSCGDVDCWCVHSEDRHGPYLSVVFRENGKTRSLALGPKLTLDEMAANVPKRPSVWDYLKVPDYRFQKMPRSSTDGWVSLVLSEAEFEARYGVSKAGDRFKRSDRFWGSEGDCERFDIELGLMEEMEMIQCNPWALYGVGTLKGIAILRRLEGRGYYQK